MYPSGSGARLLYISSLTLFLPVKSTDLTLWGQVSSSPCQFTHLEFTYSLLPNWKALGMLTHQRLDFRQTERVKDWPQEAQKHSDSEGRKDPVQVVASAFCSHLPTCSQASRLFVSCPIAAPQNGSRNLVPVSSPTLSLLDPRCLQNL